MPTIHASELSEGVYTLRTAPNGPIAAVITVVTVASQNYTSQCGREYWDVVTSNQANPAAAANAAWTQFDIPSGAGSTVGYHFQFESPLPGASRADHPTLPGFTPAAGKANCTFTRWVHASVRMAAVSF